MVTCIFYESDENVCTVVVQKPNGVLNPTWNIIQRASQAFSVTSLFSIYCHSKGGGVPMYSSLPCRGFCTLVLFIFVLVSNTCFSLHHDHVKTRRDLHVHVATVPKVPCKWQHYAWCSQQPIVLTLIARQTGTCTVVPHCLRSVFYKAL